MRITSQIEIRFRKLNNFKFLKSLKIILRFKIINKKRHIILKY